MAVNYLSKRSFKLNTLFIDLLKQKPQDSPVTEAPLINQQHYLEQLFLNRLFEKKFLGLHRVVVVVVLVLGSFLFMWSASSRQQFNKLAKQQQALHLKVQQKEALLGDERVKWQQIDRKAQHQRISLLDQLMQAMPKGIRLKKITLSTTENNVTDKLLIWGELIEKNTLTQWTNTIRLHKKVKNVSIVQLTTNKGLQLHFELQILLQDEHKK